MSAVTRLWLRIVMWTAVTATLFVALAPGRPAPRVSWPVALPLGAGVGVVLFALVARRQPRLPRAGPWPALAGKLAFFGLWATNEEVVWRRVALGELLGAGVVAALAVSTAGFALLHRSRAALHAGTGLVFGAVYLGTGVLAASVAAHWTYNVLVGGLVERASERTG